MIHSKSGYEKIYFQPFCESIIVHQKTSCIFTASNCNMRIFLIGYMGSGKSSTGKRLARALNLPFYDTDKEIENEQNKTIEEIFSDFGENYFRSIEHEYLLQLQLRNIDGVFATGGGMPCFNDNIQLMNQLGVSIFLDRPAKELVQRVETSKKSRPLISNKSDVELLNFIEYQLENRNYFYKKATIIAERDCQDIKSLVHLITEKSYKNETEILDYNHSSFSSFLEGIEGVGNPLDQLLKTYQKVRDHFLYDPYHLDLRPEGLKASSVLLKKRAWCVEKANVMAACGRRLGFPTRLSYAIVTNHIGIEKLESYLRRPEIVFHGYVEIFINGKWVSCTPAFDKKVCRLSGVEPLEFDGKQNSLFQAFKGKERFMEYIHYYGHFADVPIQLMNSEMKKYYPHLFDEVYDTKEFSFYHL